MKWNKAKWDEMKEHISDWHESLQWINENERNEINEMKKMNEMNDMNGMKETNEIREHHETNGMNNMNLHAGVSCPVEM